MGKIYKGKVVKIMEFGAFVNFLGKQMVWFHLELADKELQKLETIREGFQLKSLGLIEVKSNCQ